MKIVTLFLFSILIFVIPGKAQYSVSNDSTKTEISISKPKLYEEVISAEAQTKRGLFTVHKVQNRFYFEISDSLFERELLVVNRISKAPVGVYAGDQINENVIMFSKGPYNKVFIKNISYLIYSGDSSENGMYRSVKNSNLQPIVFAFDIKAFSKDSAGVVIDVTNLFNSDNDIFFFHGLTKSRIKLGGLQTDKSYIDQLKVFPSNIEVCTVKTYSNGSGTNTAGSNNVTFALNSSLVLLPKVPMRSRLFDARIGYFATGYIDFDANPQGVGFTAMITRWRMEPKEEDKARYLNGELVEPVNPIIYYIDPTTPKKWVPYLMQGVNDWQAAFEQAGFKNAIMAKEAPIGDSTWNIDDARHNVIVYKPSPIKNAVGPHVHDPRSGEIIETHIDWYHNLMQLLHNWYMIQAGAIDIKARKMEFSDDLMGQLIRFVATHEVGHTLGLMHNFGSSSTIPVDSLRSKTWLKTHGLTPSIMDYARFNYVAQPEDSIDETGIIPRIGEYDKWAIEWGYRWWPELPKVVEKKKLNRWIVEKLKTNKRLYFGPEFNTADPRCQSEDLGDNAMKAGLYGIKNLKNVLYNLDQWTRESDEDYSSLGRMYEELMAQYTRYIGHVLRFIGGKTVTFKSIEENGQVIEFISREQQKSAMQFLDKQLFQTPYWLLDKNIYLLGGTKVSVSDALIGIQSYALRAIFGGGVINSLLESEIYNPGKAYSAIEFLDDLKISVWSELFQNRKIEVYRRNLQKAYVVQIIRAITPTPIGTKRPFGELTGFSEDSFNDGSSLLKGHLRQLDEDVKKGILLIKDRATILHLKDLHDRINNILNPSLNK